MNPRGTEELGAIVRDVTQELNGNHVIEEILQRAASSSVLRPVIGALKDTGAARSEELKTVLPQIGVEMGSLTHGQTWEREVTRDGLRFYRDASGPNQLMIYHDIRGSWIGVNSDRVFTDSSPGPWRADLFPLNSSHPAFFDFAKKVRVDQQGNRFETRYTGGPEMDIWADGFTADYTHNRGTPFAGLRAYGPGFQRDLVRSWGSVRDSGIITGLASAPERRAYLEKLAGV